MTQIWQAELAPLGVIIKPRALPSATVTALQQKPSTQPDVFIAPWTMDYADNQQAYWGMFYSKVLPPASSNFMFYGNPAVDTLLEQAQRATSAAAQRALYARALPLIYADAAQIWVVQPNERIALRSNVKGFVYNFLYSANYYDLYALSKS